MTHRRVAMGAIAAALLAGALVSSAAQAAPIGTVVRWYSESVRAPSDIEVGPDGALWFTSMWSDSIGRMSTAGVLTAYEDPVVTMPFAITAGPDGAMWFTMFGREAIGRITMDGSITEFPAPTDLFSYLASGPDGNLWFTNGESDFIGRMTTGGEVTTFSDPGIDGPGFITAASDGNLWFTNGAGGSIGRITTGGEVTTFSDPAISGPADITEGPDGAMWFVDGVSIGRITTTGVVTTLPYTSSGFMRDITTGPDGNLWFTDEANNAIGRMTPDGTVTTFTDPKMSPGPTGIVAGPDNQIWFIILGIYTDHGFINSGIGRLVGVEGEPSAPMIPRNAMAVRGDAQATVSWLAPLDEGSSPITGYTVSAEPGGATCTTTGELSCVVAGLTNGTHYTFSVTATNEVGTSPPSAPSSPVTPVGHPYPPTSVVVVAGDGSLTVSWSGALPNGSMIQRYEARAQPGGNACITYNYQGPPPPTTCTIDGLTNGVSYTVTVKAGTGEMSGNGPPSAPSDPATPRASCGPAAAGPFPDVGGMHTFCEEIEWLAGTGVTSGFSDGTFRPGGVVTRQSLAAFLYRYAGSPAFVPPTEPTFDDVPASHAFFAEIEWVAAEGLASGFADGTFRPRSSMTRQSLAAFLHHYADDTTFEPPDVASFTDVPLDHPFFADVEWLVAAGVAEGFPDGTFRPGDPVTRQSFAAFLHRFET